MDEPETARPFSPTSERESLIVELSQGLPGSRSWLDSLSVVAIRALSRENVSAIFHPPAAKQAVPAVSATPVVSAVSSVSAVPSPVADTAGSSTQLSPDVLAKLLVLSANSERIPKHFISPPKTFGSGKLSDDEVTRLGSFRKDTRFSSTLEAHLQWLNQIAKECPHASEKSFIDNIHICLPLACLKDIEFLKRKSNSSLSEIFNFLQTHYGSSLSRSEVFKSLSDLTSCVGEFDPLTVLQKISMLLLQVTEDSEDCERAALRDSLSYLKNLLGTEMFLNLSMFLGDGNFGDLYRICKCDYKDILLARYQEKRSASGKVRQINNKDYSPEPDSSIVTAPPPPPSVEDVVRQILGKNNQPLSCFSCGSNSHLMANCPVRMGQQTQVNNPPKAQPRRSSSKKSSSSRLPYAEQKCALHQNSAHKNLACFKQLQIPCPVHQGSHSQAVCKRMDSGKSQFPPQPQFQAQQPPFQAQQPQFQAQQPPQQLSPQGYQMQPPHGYPQAWMNAGYAPQFPYQFQAYPPHPRPQPVVPQPGQAHHLALQQSTSSAASTADPIEFDDETKARLLRALSEALSE